MATISIQDLHPVGRELFLDNESYLRDLSSDRELDVIGGIVPTTTIGTTSNLITPFIITTTVPIIPLR